MPKLTLYHAAPSRSSIVHWMLEELGEPYDIHLISFKKGENLKPEFLAINPMGKLPDAQARRHGHHRSRRHLHLPRRRIPAGQAERADRQPAARRLSEVAVLRAELRGAGDHRARLPAQGAAAARRTLGFGDFDTVMNVLAKGVGAADPYLMGKQFTAADVIIGSGLRWGMMFKLIPERPEFTAYVARLNERPALKRATEKDAKLQAEQEKGV